MVYPRSLEIGEEKAWNTGDKKLGENILTYTFKQILQKQKAKIPRVRGRSARMMESRPPKICFSREIMIISAQL